MPFFRKAKPMPKGLAGKDKTIRKASFALNVLRRLKSRTGNLTLRIIGKPLLAESIAARINDPKLRNSILLIGRTKYLPKKEIRQIASKPFGTIEENERIKSSLVVASALYKRYKEQPELTGKVTKAIFGVLGNNPQSRELAAELLGNCIGAFGDPKVFGQIEFKSNSHYYPQLIFDVSKMPSGWRIKMRPNPLLN
ncbi:MAG: hypothetical protein Q7R70_02625 [Candidatus Diapherotrites archaeon]|nr:hypothetical protein [Candidatus Diapherotrites archaeon]